MRRAVPLITAVVLLSAVQRAPAQAPARTVVESQVVATGETGMQFMVSPHGAHLAAITQKGSRTVVVIDGTMGPQFDQIAPNAGTNTYVQFSHDGSRYAYVARVGSEWVIQVDGKEQLRVPVSPETGVAGGNMPLGFTSDGKHVHYGIMTIGSGPRGAKFRELHLVWDGVVGPTDGGDGPQVAYSPDGSRHAYLITVRAGVGGNNTGQNQQALVVDGKIAPYVAGALQFTADGSHLFSQRTVPGPGSVTEVLVDGKPMLRAQSIRLTMAPVGDGFVGVVSQQAPGGSPVQFLVVGAKRIPGSDCAGGGGISDVTFSADGKHVAAKCQTPAQTYFMIVDGKKGREYQSITNFAFAPDGSRAMYVGRMGMKQFAVIGDEESDGYEQLDSLRFGGTGKRTGFVASASNGRSPWAAVIDGKPIARTDNQPLTQFNFSPDGSRWACLAGQPNGYTLVLDGVDQSSSILKGFGRTFRGTKFAFSSDGKHIAYFGMPKTNSGQAQSGMFFDGKYLPLGGMYAYNPTFTPDGRHFLFLSEDAGGATETVYLDGKAVVHVDANNSLADNPTAWEMGADGALTFLAQEGQGVKRYRVVPGSDTSIETMLAMARKP
jgi:hypothetical protein